MWTIAFVCSIMVHEVIESFLLIGIRGNSILTRLNHFFYIFFSLTSIVTLHVQITEVKKQLDKTSEYKSTLYENYISGILSKEDYKALNSSYTQEKKSLEKALKQL